ncbi:DUF3970 family protein [Halalkalibacterium ligniniphilum]|uniref:DUF3970 family protein n=1 Tax=Halalkalibacterium ligniniphilum TaxID=1134413 RepID=UPI0003725F6D|nr:DUF3970 family protein [Halalkalibacterium ligniniphilum]
MRVRVMGRDQEELLRFMEDLKKLPGYEVTYHSDARDSTKTNNPKYQRSKDAIIYADVRKA